MATVSADGVVSAIATGTATITVETVDGGLTATCTLNVLAEFVDLGLPSGIKWATCNLGETGFVSSPEQYGSFYSWGETATKGNYSWSNYAFGWKKSLNKYNTDSDGGCPKDRAYFPLPHRSEKQHSTVFCLSMRTRNMAKRAELRPHWSRNQPLENV